MEPSIGGSPVREREGGDAVQGSWCQVQCCNFEEVMKRMDVNQVREARGLQSDGPSFDQNLRGPRLIC